MRVGLSKSVFALLILGVGLVLLRALMVGERAEDAHDPITRAGIDTRRMLAAFERTGDPAELRGWLTSVQEAPAMETYSCLAEWSCRNQEEFINLMGTMKPKEQQHVIELLVFTLCDSGKEADFQSAFRHHKSTVTQRIFRAIKEYSLPKP